MASLETAKASPGGSDVQGGLILRPAADRFLTQLPWLHSRHSFSFGHHHDPAWERFGPLRVINDDIIQPGTGFGLHPHRDMEIVTVMLEGVLEHRDSLGNGAALRAGEVQRMTAGTGIAHSEMNAGQDPCRLLQIWIEPEQAGLPPSYSQKRVEPGRTWTPLIEPDATGGALAIAQSVRLWRARPRRGDQLPLPLQPGCRGWLQMIAGTVIPLASDAAGPAEGALFQGDGLGFAAPALQGLQSVQDSDLLLLELP
jgi:quercetin 2,3-dioxygenase